jgi:histidyl-tRNA synthetase
MADKPAKSNKLKARLPRGLADRTPGEIAATRRMMETIRAVYERYGFEPVETPAIEYTDALGKFLPDQDRPNEGVFSFQDDDEQWLSLRYDLTAPLARHVAENFDALPKPYRSYRVGWVFRNEKPGPGRFRQFMQFDADTVGSSSPAADAEMCMMAADTMEELGIPRGSYVVKVNNRKLLDGLLESIGIGGDTNTEKRLTVLRALDKYDRLGKHEVRKLLGIERRDESGDVTKGAGLTDEQINRVLYFLTLRAEPWGIVESTKDDFNPQIKLLPEGGGEPYEIDVLTAFDKAYGANEQFRAGIDEFRQLEKLVTSAGYGNGKIIIDPSVVRGLEYYTGPVFEVDLTFPIASDDGKPVRFGSVGAGGRYDGLVSRFRGEPVPATGFSIGVSRLAAALQHLGKLESKPEPGPVVVTVFDKDRLADYQSMVARLRAAKIRAELYLGNPRNFGNQLKYADKRNAPCVVIQGSDEKAKGEVVIKDLILGAELAKLEKGREEYLQKQVEAQRSVPEVELVDTVRRVLVRHGLSPERSIAQPSMSKATPRIFRIFAIVVLAMLAVAIAALAGMIVFGTSTPAAPLASIIEPFAKVDFSDLPAVQTLPARGGTPIAFRVWREKPPSPDPQLVVIAIHGSSALSSSLHPLAKALSADGIPVYAPDIRGHGQTGLRGDIEYPGQLDDDLADLVAAVRARHANAKLVLLGFSSGGGYALHAAATPLGKSFERAVLLSPMLGPRAPTYRPTQAWAAPYIPRIIALSLLNRVGIHAFDHLTVLAFAINPQRANILTRHYSWLLLRAFATNDYAADLRNASPPISVLIGENDELFDPGKFAPTVDAVRTGIPVTIIPGLSHIEITTDPRAVPAIVAAVRGAGLPEKH